MPWIKSISNKLDIAFFCACASQLLHRVNAFVMYSVIGCQQNLNRASFFCCVRNIIMYVPYRQDIHYNDVIMVAIASKITSLNIVYSTVYSGADQRKHQSSAPLAFVRGINRRPVNSPHRWPVMRKMFPLDDVIMNNSPLQSIHYSLFS